MSKFKIDTTDGLSFEISSEELDQLDVIENEDGGFHLIYKDKSYNIEILESDYLKKSYILNINEKEIALSIRDDLDVAIEKMGFSKKTDEVGGQVLSPMPGLVVRLDQTIGAEVKNGDILLILEAMKMENIIKAPSDGKIKNILIKEGETVGKHQLLIELE